MKSPFEIEVTDEVSACAYLVALALSPWQYHIDDDPSDPLLTQSQVDHLRHHTNRAFGVLGNETAWAVYYGAHVVNGTMN